MQKIRSLGRQQSVPQEKLSFLNFATMWYHSLLPHCRFRDYMAAKQRNSSIYTTKVTGYGCTPETEKGRERRYGKLLCSWINCISILVFPVPLQQQPRHKAMSSILSPFSSKSMVYSRFLSHNTILFINEYKTHDSTPKFYYLSDSPDTQLNFCCYSPTEPFSLAATAATTTTTATNNNNNNLCPGVLQPVRP
jgi:hypothetical protein